MDDLANKHRPRLFADVVGQELTVDWLRKEAADGAGGHVLLSGPQGTGKTTVARIYAKALFCDRPNGGEPCGGCANCAEFGEDRRPFDDFTLYQCGEHSTVEEIQGLLDVMRTHPRTTNRRVAMLDEVHNLSRRAMDALLNIVEFPPKWATTFILATSKPESLPPTLRSRLPSFELKPLSLETGARLLIKICDAEGLAYEAKGIALLQASVGGHPREMLRALEKAAAFGAITEANVRSARNLHIVGPLTSYCDELLHGDLGKQIAVIDTWLDAPSRKLDFLYRFFVTNYLVGVRHVRREDPIMDGIPVDFQQRFLDEMSRRARRLQLSEDQIWNSSIGILTPEQNVTEYQLLMVLTRLDRLINPAAVPEAKPSPGPMPASRRHGWRAVRGAGASGETVGNYSAWKEIHPVWQAASFLMQHYGALLNVRMTLRPRNLGIPDHAAGAHLASGLVHELGMRLRDWGTPAEREFHWLLRHEAEGDGALVTRVMMSVPGDHLPDALDWVRNRLRRHRAGDEGARALLMARRDAGTPEQRLRFHWNCVRALSRSLDGGELARSQDEERAPLVERLRIPRRWRGAMGDIRGLKKRLASESLGREARRLAAGDAMPFLSALDDGAWGYIDSGWELLEHQDRVAERRRRQEEAGRVRALFHGDDPLTVARCAEELARLRAGYPADPRRRLRSWDGWWHASAGGVHVEGKKRQLSPFGKI